MNISYNWLTDFLKLDKTPEELSLILTDIGLEVESLKVVQSVPGGLEGLVIGEVLTCEQHPNADRLKTTTVNIGGGEPLSIVCGAPNVAAGQKVVVATVGATLYPIDGEPFKIKKSKIRGEQSEGMICAEDEIGLGKSHDGIIVLDSSVRVGEQAKDFYNLKDDYVYTIGLTPNRADATSHLGVARDIAAFLRNALPLPQIALPVAAKETLKIDVEVADAHLAPRYSGIILSGLVVDESPDWLKERLSVIGIRAVNNVVDITNYILHDLGQPLHAFDLDTVKGNQVLVRNAAEGELFTTLDGVERKLSSEDLVIADAQEPMCLAGVFGGEYSGVTANTTRIFLESAYFNAVSVRKTSKRHALKTDSSFRFERGTDPDMTVYALYKAVQLLQDIAGAEVRSEIVDIYPEPVQPNEVRLSFANVNKLIGEDIPTQEIKSILTALAIVIREEDAEGLSLEVPAYRVDVTREVDVIEEILRIYGYNNIEIKSQIKASLNASLKPDKEVVINQVSDLLIANGFREILSNSLTKLDYAEDEDSAVKLLNALSSDLDTMRQNLLYAMLAATAYNQKRQQADLKLFEFGHTYFTANNQYLEEEHLGLLLAGDVEAKLWSEKPKAVSFYQIKAAVDSILKRLNVQGYQVSETDSSHYAYGMQYTRGPQLLVTYGQVSAAILDKMDVSGEVYFADFHWDQILKALKSNAIRFKEIPKFPAVHRDLALLVDVGVTFDQLRKVAFKTEKKLLKEVEVFDVYRGKNLPEGKKSYALTFTLQDEEKTLTDHQIDGIIKKLIVNFEVEVGASVR